MVITREAVRHLVFFAGEPFREEHSTAVKQQASGRTSDPEMEGWGVDCAGVKAGAMEPTGSCGAVCASENDGAGRMPEVAA